MLHRLYPRRPTSFPIRTPSRPHAPALAAFLLCAAPSNAQEEKVGDRLAALLSELDCGGTVQSLRARFVEEGGTAAQFQAEALALVARGQMERAEPEGEDGAVMRLVDGEGCD